MDLIIKIKNSEVVLELLNKGKLEARSVWKDKRDLSTRLLKEIAALLTKQKVDIKAIKKFKLRSDIDQNYSSQKIAQAVVASLNYAQTHNY
ncbi:MAG: hypothetical protein GF332_01600 [Candidatus Moranbacteria bacterium]|nr:hypothetical protein [Candidatus Moranbacteria bacterium]